MFSWEILGYTLAAIGLNMHFGYTGLLNFGQAGFMAIGAYSVGISIAVGGLSLGQALLVAIAVVVVLAFIMGVPAMRGLRTDYFAIVTIAVAEIIRLFMRSASLEDYTGGSDGLQGFVGDFRSMNPYGGGFIDMGLFKIPGNLLWVITVGWTLVAVGFLLVWLLMRSPWGRVLKAIREDEDVVRALGKNVSAYKMQSLIFGGIFGALGGIVFAFGQASANSDNFTAQTTFFAYAVLILGGAARVLSPLAGAIIFWLSLIFIENVLVQAVAAGIIPTTIVNNTQTSLVRFVLLGLALMLLMIFRPQGIFGDKRELQLNAR
ncbi:MAG: branched-chain amino acid ABC transporter permease [Actinophytocola sp.]|nr:branched-chain amino acid ABC transporter permease [Actinophytocola sp.]